MTKPVVYEISDLPALLEARDLFNRVWKPLRGADVISVELLRALSHAGNYVSAAYRDGRMVGASAAFFGAPPGDVLHSHVTAAELPGQGVGLLLKRHQRDWALSRGLSRIAWTFDPLVSRNAYFNLVKLGAVPETYLRSFYGRMPDAINKDDDSDRLLITWHLSPGPKPGLPADIAPLLLSRNGRPVLLETAAETVTLALPPDIESLRVKDPALALEWRVQLRAALEPLMAAPHGFLAFRDRSTYVFHRGPVSTDLLPMSRSGSNKTPVSSANGSPEISVARSNP